MSRVEGRFACRASKLWNLKAFLPDPTGGTSGSVRRFPLPTLPTPSADWQISVDLLAWLLPFSLS